MTVRSSPTVTSPDVVTLDKVPTLVKLDAVTPELSVLPVSVPAAAVTVIFPVPSKLVPFIVLAVSKAVAVAAFPVVEPEVPLVFPVTLPVILPTNVPLILLLASLNTALSAG